MSRTQAAGQPGAPGRRPPFADRRLLAILAGLLVLVVGFYVFQGWREGADRAARRGKLLGAVAAELSAEKPDLDRLGDLMAGLTMLEDADSAAEVLTPRAQIELLRGRADRAYRLFGQIADAPGATAAQQRLGARIQLARQDSFGGDAASAQAMLEQVVTFSQNAYADSGDTGNAPRQLTGEPVGHRSAVGHAGHVDGGGIDLKARADIVQHRLEVRHVVNAIGTGPAADTLKAVPASAGVPGPYIAKDACSRAIGIGHREPGAARD